MRSALWPDADAEELRAEVAAFFAGEAKAHLPHCIFVAEQGDALIGMLELSLRPYVDGCDGSPVPFIEGWYVEPEARRTGIGGALMRTAEEWAIAQGYSEMASDALLDNDVGHWAHASLGFEEVERAIRFRKVLKR